MCSKHIVWSFQRINKENINEKNGVQPEQQENGEELSELREVIKESNMHQKDLRKEGEK